MAFDDFSVEMSELELKKKNDLNAAWWGITEGGSIETRPVLYNDTIIFGSANHNIYAVEINALNERWKLKTGSFILSSSPVIYGNSVIIGSYDKNVYCVDAKNGELKWKFKTQGEIASPGVVHDGLFFITGRDMMLYALDCETGELVWKFKTYNSNVSEPVIHNDTLILHSSDRNLYCLNCRDGSLLWKYTAEEELVSDVAFPIQDDILYFGSTGGILYAMDLNTQVIKWKFYVGDYGISKAGIVLDDMLIQPTNKGILYAISTDGNVLWKFMREESVGGVVTDGDRIYVSGGENNFFYCLDKDGSEVWKFKTQGYNWSPAVIKDGFVYFGSYDCNLYKLDKITGDLAAKFNCPGGVSTYPDWKEYFEVSVSIPETEVEEIQKQRYSVTESTDEESTSEYKTRITYQVSTQYSSKGKYQIDSREEAF